MPNPFTHHPDAIGETYGQHFGVALRYSGKLFAAACAALVHAFLPFLFEKTASNAIKGMYADMTRRSANTPVEAAGSVRPAIQAAE